MKITDVPAEASMDDAPSWLDNDEANAWAAGFNAFRDRLLKNLEEKVDTDATDG